MGVVLPFERRSAKRSIAPSGVTHKVDMHDVEWELRTALRDGCDHRATLDAARPLLKLCRDRYGCTVMRDGLPSDRVVLVEALLALSRGLRQLDGDLDDRRPPWTYGIYFGQRELAWFEDGYGSMSGLTVPIEVDAAELGQFIRHRITAH